MQTKPDPKNIVWDQSDIVWEDEPTKTTEGMNVPQKFLAGVGGSMYMAGKGIQQKGAQLGEKIGLVSPETTKRITQEGEEAKSDLERLKQESTSGKVGAFVGDVAPGMAIPGGVAGGMVKRAATGAIAGAIQGAARFTGEGESSAKNAAVGGVAGAAMPAITYPIAKVANAIAGKVTKPINIGAAQKVPTTLGEDIGSPALQRVETLAERIPGIGLTGFRKKQHAAAEQAAKEQLGKFVVDKASGVRGALERNRSAVSSLYNQVKSNISEFNNLKAYALETSKAANEITERYPSFWEQFGDKRVLGLVKDFKKGAGKVHSFDDLWELRKSIGDMLGQAKQKIVSGDVNKSQYDMLSKVYSSINKDMDSFASSVGRPDISKALANANTAYKQHVVKYNILDRAMDKSMGQEGTGKVFSPQRFHSELNKILTKEKYSGLFTDAEKKELTGIANIMTTVKRAGQFAENPPTGNRFIDALLAGGGVAGLATNAAATVKSGGALGGTAAMLRFLTTTDAGKRLAMAASTIEPDSKSMRPLVDYLYRGARSGLVSSNLESSNPKKDPLKDLLAGRR